MDYCELLVCDPNIRIIEWIIGIIGVQISDGLLATIVTSFIFRLLGLLGFDYLDDSFCNRLYGLFGFFWIIPDYCFQPGLF